MPTSCYAALGVLLQDKSSSSKKNPICVLHACSVMRTKAELGQMIRRFSSKVYSWDEWKRCCRCILHLWVRHNPHRECSAKKLKLWPYVSQHGKSDSTALHSLWKTYPRCYEEKTSAFFCICNTGLWAYKNLMKKILYFCLLAKIFTAEIHVSQSKKKGIKHDEIRHTSDRISMSNWWSTELAEFPQFWDFRNRHELQPLLPYWDESLCSIACGI